jgi:hypothetical protein
MFVFQFDPITTEIVINKRQRRLTTSSATMSELIVSNDLSLLIDNLTIINQIELTEAGSFIINDNSTVEVT